MRGSQFYNNDCLAITVGEINYDVDVKARGTYTYEPETRWEPAYSDFEIEEINAVWKDGEGNVVEETLEMYDALESYLKDKVEWERECPYDEAEEREHYY